MLSEITALLVMAVAVPAGSPVTDQVRSATDGTVSLSHSVVVAAPAAEVSTAISTAEGWKSWAVPVAWFDARSGVMETSYNPVAKPGDANNIEQQFLDRVPGRRLAFRTVKAPAGFPHFDALRQVTQTFELFPEGGGTRVVLTGSGYGADAAGQATLAFFKTGNRMSLEMLRDRFVNGPIDWTKKLAKRP